MQYSSLNNPRCEREWVGKGKERLTLRKSLSIYVCVCVCPIYCKPRCNPEQEAGQGVTVGVKASLLP